MSECQTIAVLGLGPIGVGMAQALTRAGHAVLGFDEEAARLGAFQAEGGQSGDVIALGRSVDTVLVVARNADQAGRMLFGDDAIVPHLRRQAAVLNAGVVPPEFARATALRCREYWVHYLDAPACGPAQAAIEGQMKIIASGTRDAFKSAAPVLEAISSEVVDLGDMVGAASSMKAINQMLSGVHLAAMTEALQLAQAEGIDLARLIKVISACSGASAVLEDRAGRLLEDRADPSATLAAAGYELDLALTLARDAGTAAPLAAAALQQIIAASGPNPDAPDAKGLLDAAARLNGLAKPGA